MMGDPARLPYLTLVPGAEAFLKQYGAESVLLSAGVKEYQLKKLELLGITHYFRDIVIVLLPEEKAAALQKIVEKQKVLPGSVILIGDRIDQEIRAGNRMGMKTVRMHLPEGKYARLVPEGPEETPAYAVRDFTELMELPLF
jgi:FMN phosphatase YigB (HAD superfamily)